VAERQVLGDAIHVGRIHAGQAAQGTPAFGPHALGQVPPAGAGAQHFSAGRNLETFGHGLLGLDAFGSSHKIFIAKERKLYAAGGGEASAIFGFLDSNSVWFKAEGRSASCLNALRFQPIQPLRIGTIRAP
jgi:hypothetical protein